MPSSVQRPSRLILAAGAALLLVCGNPRRALSFSAALRSPPAAGESAAHQKMMEFPELSRVEELMYKAAADGGARAPQSMRVLNTLAKFHLQSAVACSVDDWNCAILDALDRLCAGIRSWQGVDLLSKVSHAVHTFQRKFPSWNAAFSYADTKHRGHLTVDNLRALMRSIGAGLTDDEVRIVFRAADTNGDGFLSPQEFARFWAAMASAETPLHQLEPREALHPEHLVPWSSTGALGSWADAMRTAMA